MHCSKAFQGVDNDLGCWLCLVHTGVHLGYECAKFDPTDPVFNPMWRAD